MKYNIQKITMAVLVSCLVLGGQFQAQAAKDPVGLPSKGDRAVLNVVEEGVTVQAPNDEVQEKVEAYLKWFDSLKGKQYYNKKHEVVDAQTLAKEVLIEDMRVRLEFYYTSHRWTDKSYGRIILTNMFNDYVKHINRGDRFHLAGLGTTTETVQPYDSVDSPMFNPVGVIAPTDNTRVNEWLKIEEKHMENVYLSEVRSYANEMLIFSLEQVIEDNLFNDSNLVPKEK